MVFLQRRLTVVGPKQSVLWAEEGGIGLFQTLPGSAEEGHGRCLERKQNIHNLGTGLGNLFHTRQPCNWAG